MLRAAMLAAAIGVAPAAAAELDPARCRSMAIDCGMVRAFVAERGEAQALAMAIAAGCGWRKIREARACLQRGK